MTKRNMMVCKYKCIYNCDMKKPHPEEIGCKGGCYHGAKAINCVPVTNCKPSDNEMLERIIKC
jgi:hypothetical protein